MTAYETLVAAAVVAVENCEAEWADRPTEDYAVAAVAAVLAALPRVAGATVTEALSATTAAEVGGEPVTVVYRPAGLAVLALSALAALVPKEAAGS